MQQLFTKEFPSSIASITMLGSSEKISDSHERNCLECYIQRKPEELYKEQYLTFGNLAKFYHSRIEVLQIAQLLAKADIQVQGYHRLCVPPLPLLYTILQNQGKT